MLAPPLPSSLPCSAPLKEISRAAHAWSLAVAVVVARRWFSVNIQRYGHQQSRADEQNDDDQRCNQ